MKGRNSSRVFLALALFLVIGCSEILYSVHGLQGSLGILTHGTVKYPVSLIFGVVGTWNKQDTSHVLDAYQRGIRVWRICVSWHAYETSEGKFNQTYVSLMRDYIHTIKSAGLKVNVQIAFQYPPKWIFNYSGSRYVNQYGDEWVGDQAAGNNVVNAVFNHKIREIQANTIKHFFSDFGTDFWAVDLSIGPYGEISYPDANYLGNKNCYWAYDMYAQLVCPVPRWRPGEPSPNHINAELFANWYMDSMKDYILWQINEIRKYFTGPIHGLFGDWGLRTGWFENAVNADLNGSSHGEYPTELMQRGMDFKRYIEAVTDTKFVISCTWMDPDPSSYNDESLSDTNWSNVKYLAEQAKSRSFRYIGENGGARNFEWTFNNVKRLGYTGLIWHNEKWLYEDPSCIDAYEQYIQSAVNE